MPSYRNIELSTPRFETSGLRHLAFLAPSLGHHRGEVTLWLPPGAESLRSLPLVVLLHGVHGTHLSWAFNGGAHRSAAEMAGNGQIRPMVLAMPSDGLWGQGTGYVHHQHADYERWIVDDVVECVREVLPCLDEHSRVFMAGFSMGGYGALRLGAKYSDRFSALSAHSAITDFAQIFQFIQEDPARYRLADTEGLDVFYWMKKHKAVLPSIRFDCGVEDKLFPRNQQLHEQMTAAGITHDFFALPGSHSWLYWEQHLRETLLFFDAVEQQSRLHKM